MYIYFLKEQNLYFGKKVYTVCLLFRFFLPLQKRKHLKAHQDVTGWARDRLCGVTAVVFVSVLFLSQICVAGGIVSSSLVVPLLYR